MKLSKAVDKLPLSVLEEIFENAQQDPSSLDRVVSASEAAIAKATKERDANPQYQEAKQACKDLSEGLSEVKKFQKAKAAIALAILDFANLSPEDEGELDRARNRVEDEQRSRKK